MTENKCKRCGRSLRSVESIKLGYGKTCFRIVQLQKNKKTEVKSEVNSEIAFLKCEISTLKRMIKNIQINGTNINPIERIRKDNYRPERNTDINKANFGNVVAELKELFNGTKNVYNYLTPVNSRTTIELPPVMIA